MSDGEWDMMEGRENKQTAPYPAELAALVKACKLNPGWSVRLQDLDRGQGSEGLTLVIRTRGYDSYHPERGESYAVLHYFIVPAASFDYRSWRRWLFDRYLDVCSHEACEFFQVDGARPFAPHHGDGEDPYVIFEAGEDRSDARRRPGQ